MFFLEIKTSLIVVNLSVLDDMDYLLYSFKEVSFEKETSFIVL